eukprot:TRINITY_DN6442_c0_g1_i2.p1 TRINITY_DN6442_c0_g1~~TRINITY_DN6442_c0_g1_i2.p1  ORF type:complete len:1957 (-),score=395.96 TRINITY_DN6442_c0_g1_i2:23-5893(-)
MQFLQSVVFDDHPFFNGSTLPRKKSTVNIRKLNKTNRNKVSKRQPSRTRKKRANIKAIDTKKRDANIKSTATEQPLFIPVEDFVENPVKNMVVKEKPKQGVRKSFFDAVQRGRVSAIKSLLKREHVNVNLLTPVPSKKQYRNMCNTSGWGALHFAAWFDNADMARYLISLGANVNLKNIREQAPLHVASVRGSTKVASVLLEYGADVDILNPNRGDQTPLQCASINGHTGMIELLCSHGADLKHQANNLSGPCLPMGLAAIMGNTDSLVFIIRKMDFRDVQVFCSSSRENIFVNIAKKNHFDTCKYLLQELERNEIQELVKSCHSILFAITSTEIMSLLFDYVDDSSTQFRLIHTLVSKNDVDGFNAIIDRISLSTLNTHSYYLHPIITQACLVGNYYMVEKLLNLGCNPSTSGYQTTTPIDAAVFNNDVDILKLLLNNGALLSKTNPNNTPLLVASSNGYSDIIDILCPLLPNDLYTLDANGYSSLHCAAMNGHVSAVERLLSFGFDPNFKLEYMKNTTAMHLAAFKGHNIVIKALVNGGADLNIRKSCRKNGNAIEIAHSKGFVKTVRLLLDLGAEDTRNLGVSVDSSVSVNVLQFNDSSPLNYPADLYSLSDRSLDRHKVQAIDVDIDAGVHNVKFQTGHGGWKTVKVFISSTFSDMQSERNHLVKYVFPRLRKEFSNRRIHVLEVDLRWGVTQEEVERGNTVEICLSEIDNCPIFLGLVGNRYGWVPDRKDIRDDVRIKYNIIDGKSVTHMEVERGAFGRQDSTSFILFRDDASLEGIPDMYMHDFVDNPQKVNNLKSAIRSNNVQYSKYTTEFYKVENNQVIFRSLENFGEQAYDWIYRAINEKYPELDVELNPLEEEKFFHDAFLEHRTANFVGRRKQISEAEDYIRSNINQPLVIAGAAGSGKSALTAYITKIMKESHMLVYHFIGASSDSTDIKKTLQRICSELIKMFGLWEVVNDELDYDDLKILFVKLLELSAKELMFGRKLVIIIDALNQLENGIYRALLLEWLPKTLPKNVKIMVSCLPSECLDVLTTRNHPQLSIGKLEIQDREAIVTHTLARYNKKLDSNQMRILLQKEDAVKPLYLIICCEELRLFGIYTKLTEKIQNLAENLEDLLDQVLLRLETEIGPLLPSVLSLLECSRHGLIETEIMEILQVSQVKWSSISLNLSLFLRSTGEEGELDFFHRQISKAVRRKYLNDTQKVKQTHCNIAQYYLEKSNFEIMFDFELTDDHTYIENAPRAMTELPYHLYKSQMWVELNDTLCRLNYIYRRLLGGDIYGLLSDYNLINDDIDIPENVMADIDQYKKFFQVNAYKLVQPKALFQIALNQNNSQQIQRDATYYIRNNPETPYIEWKNRQVEPTRGLINKFHATMDVNDVCFSPDMMYILSAQRDGTVALWDSKSGELLVKYSTHSDRVNSCCFSKDGSLFASGSTDQTIYLYETTTRQIVGSKKLTSGVNSIDFSYDKSSLAVGLENKRIEIYNLNNNTLTRDKSFLAHDSAVYDVEYSPEGLLLSASNDKLIKLWDQKYKKVVQFEGHTKAVRECHWASNGNIVSCGGDGLIIIWAQSGNIINKLSGHKDNVESCAVSPDGNFIVSGSWDRTVRLWNMNGSVGIYHGTSHFVNAVNFSPDGELVVVGSPDHSIKVYLKEHYGSLFYKDPAQIHDKMFYIDYHPQLEKIVTASWDRLTKIHDIKKLRTDKKHYTTNTITRHSRRVNIAKFFPKGDRICTCSMDSTVRVFNTINGSEQLKLTGHKGNVFTLVVSHDGNYAASGGDDHTVRLWDLDLGEELAVLSGHSDWVCATAFSPYSRRLVTGGRDNVLKLWNTETGDQLETIEGHTNCILEIRYSPNGKVIASASEDRTCKIWDAYTLQLLHDLRGHTNEIICCAFLDDDHVITGSSDQTIRIWNIVEGVEVWVFHAIGGISGLEVTENNEILAADASGIIYLLEMNNIL